MAAVVSNRVKAGFRDPLPPGAVEAEFAHRMARRIRSGLDEVITEPTTEDVAAAVAEKLAAPKIKVTRDAVAEAEKGLARLKAWKADCDDIRLAEVSAVLGICVKWVKRIKQRDGWHLTRPSVANAPSAWSVDDVIASAEKRLEELRKKQRRT